MIRGRIGPSASLFDPHEGESLGHHPQLGVLDPPARQASLSAGRDLQFCKAPVQPYLAWNLTLPRVVHPSSLLRLPLSPFYPRVPMRSLLFFLALLLLFGVPLFLYFLGSPPATAPPRLREGNYRLQEFEDAQQQRRLEGDTSDER